jgi:hypothetical protein
MGEAVRLRYADSNNLREQGWCIGDVLVEKGLHDREAASSDVASLLAGSLEDAIFHVGFGRGFPIELQPTLHIASDTLDFIVEKPAPELAESKQPLHVVQASLIIGIQSHEPDAWLWCGGGREL